jgi:L-aminopeptidase/D-esterase-like protein
LDLFANCTFAVVAVDMRLDRRSANRIAEMAATGLEATLSPAHTMFDFDVVIVLGCGKGDGDIHAVGAVAAELVRDSLLRGVREGRP